MRKKALLSIFTLLLAITLVGCKGENDTARIPTVPEQFEGELEVSYGDYIITGYVKRLVAGSCTFDVTSPKEIEGLQIEIENGTVTLSFYGIKYELDEGRLPEDAKIKDLASVLDNLTGEITTENKSYNETNRTLEGDINGVKYVASFNEEGIVEKIDFK